MKVELRPERVGKAVGLLVSVHSRVWWRLYLIEDVYVNSQSDKV